MTCDLLAGIIMYVNNITKECVSQGMFDFVDDVVRQFLSEIGKLNFVLCQQNAGNSLVYSSLHGLHTMGGPRGWTEESVVSNLTDWVVGKRSNKIPKKDFGNRMRNRLLVREV